MYHAVAGRFVSRDPIGYDAKDPNFYRYVRNKPVGRLDPMGLSESACPASKRECDAALAQIDNTIAQMVAYASDGHNHTLAEAVAAARPWATTTGHRSDELKKQPQFFQEAVEELETSGVLRATTLVVWFEEWLLSSIPGLNGKWNTGNGDAWIRMEIWRSLMVKKRVQSLCGNAK